MANQIIPGNTYYMDISSIWKDTDGDEYAMFYADKAGNKKIGNLLVSHFKIEEQIYDNNGVIRIYKRKSK